MDATRFARRSGSIALALVACAGGAGTPHPETMAEVGQANPGSFGVNTPADGEAKEPGAANQSVTNPSGGTPVGTGDGTSGGVPGAAGLGATGTGADGTGLPGTGGGVPGAAGLGATGLGAGIPSTIDASTPIVIIVN